MRRKQIYIAEREELVIHGLTMLFQVLPEPVSIYGLGKNAEEVLQDFSVHAPDVLFIDEKLMYQQLPLYLVLSDRYPQTSTVLMHAGFQKPVDSEACVDYCISKAVLDEDRLAKLWSDLSARPHRHKIHEDSFDILPIKQYIVKHLKEDLTLEAVAQEFGYNYTYLSTCFSKYVKQGFKQYVNELRIRRACQLLSDGAVSISEAGCEAGYSSQSYFTQVFKKYTGCTPSAYQLRHSRHVRPEKSVTPSDVSCIPQATSPHICEKCG